MLAEVQKSPGLSNVVIISRLLFWIIAAQHDRTFHLFSLIGHKEFTCISCDQRGADGELRHRKKKNCLLGPADYAADNFGRLVIAQHLLSVDSRARWRNISALRQPIGGEISMISKWLIVWHFQRHLTHYNNLSCLRNSLAVRAYLDLESNDKEVEETPSSLFQRVNWFKYLWSIPPLATHCRSVKKSYKMMIRSDDYRLRLILISIKRLRNHTTETF